eukprot:TRINITY_DN47329_c0_g1_i1.p1 TRINITY_DN47329_c0_g1~~TRINITY_DN47329_c0_g1_i1.p1  ORF type:complete len:229 (+),score=24.38 TRINITY_DN47329_c0_g1_i1:228-914(+)
MASFMSGGQNHGGSNPTASEVQLWSTNAEREQYESLADLFAIIVTTEKLEKAYMRDLISPQEYEPACAKLINQFKTLRKSLQHLVPDVDKFMSTYQLDCPSARNRLLVAGVPATVEHKVATTASADSGNTSAAVAEAVQYFITAMNALEMHNKAVDQVHPVLSPLYESLCSLPMLPPEFEGKTKVREWLSKVNSMPAYAELSDDEVRQLSFDLQSSYDAFMQSLGRKG